MYEKIKIIATLVILTKPKWKAYLIEQNTATI